MKGVFVSRCYSSSTFPSTPLPPSPSFPPLLPSSFPFHSPSFPTALPTSLYPQQLLQLWSTISCKPLCLIPSHCNGRSSARMPLNHSLPGNTSIPRVLIQSLFAAIINLGLLADPCRGLAIICVCAAAFTPTLDKSVSSYRRLTEELRRVALGFKLRTKMSSLIIN